MKVIVTGAKGYIGKSFVEEYRNSYELVEVSLRETPIQAIDFSGVGAVIHLSALVHQKKNIDDKLYFKINTDQTVALAATAKAHGVKHFIFFSSSAVYGSHGSLKNPTPSFNENSLCTPTDAYGKSKLLAEEKILKLESEEFKISIIRPPVVYGKGAPGNMERLRKLVNYLPVLPFRHNQHFRSVVGINNLVCFIASVLEKRINGILIPQDEQPCSIQFLAFTLANGSKRRIALFKLPDILFKIPYISNKRIIRSLYGSFLLDSTQTNTRLGYRAPYSTECELMKVCS